MSLYPSLEDMVVDQALQGQFCFISFFHVSIEMTFQNSQKTQQAQQQLSAGNNGSSHYELPAVSSTTPYPQVVSIIFCFNEKRSWLELCPRRWVVTWDWIYRRRICLPGKNLEWEKYNWITLKVLLLYPPPQTKWPFLINELVKQLPQSQAPQIKEWCVVRSKAALEWSQFVAIWKRNSVSSSNQLMRAFLCALYRMDHQQL